ncbi:MAG: ABC transporter ATP-binding protein [Anaerolineae bacterium]|nr:ABC transporter ATP-binding protein [Anaerolineae bacterium]
MTFLEVDNIHKEYNSAPLLTGVSFGVAQGDIACLLGPSGSGKTTLLRIIAGLETAEQGTISLDDHDVTHIPVHHRGVGLMFQDYALFPHRSIAQNVAFGLKMQKLRPELIQQRVREVLNLVGMEKFAERNVIELSGGERQRVALARSLAPNPKLLLLDEPLGALDRNLRERLLEELPLILRLVGVTTITVTHDQEEAFALADQVVILHNGVVAQQGSPHAVYGAPADTWVADFLGLDNLIAGVATSDQTVDTQLGQVVLGEGSARAGYSGNVLVYPAAVHLLNHHSDQGNTFSGTIEHISFHGHTFSVTLYANGIDLHTILVGGCDCHQGQHIDFWLDPAHLIWLPDGNSG